ncbi:MAG TPA: crotonase/enoyl-CoA hydratase family protein [Gryllotalpicola sp.]
MASENIAAAPSVGAQEPIQLSEEDGVLVIRFNRPEVRNAVNREFAVQLGAALDRLDAEPTLRAAVLTGNGKGFSSGMDLGALLQGEDPHVGDRGFAGIAERSAAKPLIAAIEGFALAGGLEIAMSCDILVAGEGAIFGLPEPKRGIVAAGGGLVRLAERIPYYVAMEIVLTGNPIDARRAYEVGLISQLTEAGGAFEKAMDIAHAIVQNAPLAITMSKAILTESRDWPADEAFARQRRYSDIPAASQDAHEGATAFKEKRPAVWLGR